MNAPTVGHWYINVTLPVAAFMRVQVKRIEKRLVWLTIDPRDPGEFAWHVQKFGEQFRPCEDRRGFVELECQSPCPCCDSPLFQAVVDRVVAAHEIAEEKARLAAWRKQQRARRARNNAIMELARKAR